MYIIMMLRSGFTTFKRQFSGAKWAINQDVRTLTFIIPKRFNSSSGVHTIDDDEVKKFSDISQTWWNEGGEFKALHTLNRLRIPLIRDGIVKDTSKSPKSHNVLDGMKILDVGCGGGILSEPLARLGADVTGIDASEENIKMAAWHAHLDKEVAKNIRYLAKPVEDIVDDERESYDAVVASEIIEHVKDPASFVRTCCALVKPEGSIFLTTINKSRMSWALAVVAAERILRLVPAGAHDWNKFITPEELQIMLQENDFQVRLVHGMLLNPATLRWTWTGDTSMNYALHAIKAS